MFVSKRYLIKIKRPHGTAVAFELHRIWHRRQPFRETRLLLADDLLPLLDAGVTLGLLEVEGAQAFLTEAGREWYTADIQTSKEIFARLAVERAPLVRTICKALENSDDGSLRDDFFRDLLRRGFSEAETQRQLDIAIDWGRYGELFDYDADSGELVLAEVYAALEREANLRGDPR